MPDRQVVEDIQLLKEAQCGNAEAFGELYERYAPTIYRFLYAHLDNPFDAEDLTEEAFFRAWRALPRYQDQGVPFRAFLFRIAHNLMVDFYRSDRRPGELDPEQRDESIGTGLSANLEHQELRHSMTQLRKDYQIVLSARFLSDLSTEETAKVMGRSAGAVRVLQHRALGALRKLMENGKGCPDEE